MTLTELLLGLALGGIVLAMVLQLLASGRAARQSAENLADLEERAAFALTALEQDLLLAGYWGTHADGSLLSVAPGVRVHCRGVTVTASALATAPLSASDGAFALPCPAASGHVGGTDTLIVRHAEPGSAAAEAGRVQLCTTALAGEIFQDGVRPAACPADQPVRNVQVHGWYLNTTSSEYNLPALYRYTLTSDGLLQNQEVMPGIEDFQLTLGVDRDGDYLIDGFVDPGAAPSARVLAVRLWLLLRTARAESGHVDDGPWYSIDTDSRAPRRPADRYRRSSAERVIWLRNAGGL